MKRPEITKLYKYRSGSDRDMEMLAKSNLYFAASNQFNDLFDCRGRKDFEFADDKDFIRKCSLLKASQDNMRPEEAIEFISDLARDPARKEAYIRTLSDTFQRTVLESFGIYCLSEIPDHMLLWAHYADGHKGFCLEYGHSKEGFFENAEPVDYPKDDSFPDIGYWGGPKSSALLDQLEKVILTKSQHWSYEKEWRLIQRPSESPSGYVGHIVACPRDQLTAVIFGARMPEKKRAEIRAMLNGTAVQFKRIEPVRNKFQLTVVNC